MSALIQAIPEGFKQTDVGVIPVDWKIKNIGDFATVSSGGTPNRKVADYWDGDIPWVTTTLIKGGDISYANEFITSKGLDNSSARMCKAGSILMAMYGQGKTRGKAGVLTINASINQACAAIEVNKKNAQEYVLHTLNYMYKEIRELSNSGGQENLSSGIIKGIKIPLPSELEQTAIANALSDVDALLTELENLIDKKQAIKTATMQQLLTGKTRLPQFATYTEGDDEGKRKGTKHSELGEIPEDWDVCLIDDVVDSLSSGGTPFRGNPSFYKGVNRWITSGELKYGVINDTIEKISDDAIKKSNLKVHPEGTFLMAITGLEAAGTRGSCGIVGKPAATNQSCMAIYPNKKLTSKFLFHWYVYNGEELALTYCQGTKQLSYTAGLLKTLPILLPRDTGEQSAIATILSDMDNEIQTLEQRLKKTRQIKQGMMQQLLTGRTRLPY
ncbi:restriction endonuclease subunit S [Colwellia sp. E2M01]|uniref:restriction endonuclease subunit S n=1 Tax=Colwellia sp. E2M01 TaxID=2841561 RepID=UPI001C0A2979|nr:restriction endonuclease subunit S [Colwellia sp. E2M01]MBU2872126.1 restriction endonuclease subunit S [Colwellia sp. E2M01]